MKSKATLGSVLGGYSDLQRQLIVLTRKHPGWVLAASAGLGFTIGCFGFVKVLQSGLALKIQDKVDLSDFFVPSSNSARMNEDIPQAHA